MFLLALLLFIATISRAESSPGPSTPNISSLVWPSELYSPLIPQKLLNTSAQPTPSQYPQYTDHTIGKWKWFSPDLWTTGFLPAMLYELETRRRLCHGPGAGNADTNWVDLARSWSTPEVSLEVVNHVKHDVGFLSYPFVQELLLYVF